MTVAPPLEALTLSRAGAELCARAGGGFQGGGDLTFALALYLQSE